MSAAPASDRPAFRGQMIPDHFPASLDESLRLLDAMRRWQSLLTSSREPSRVLDASLLTLLEWTGSAYGFLGEVRSDAAGARRVSIRSLQTDSADPRLRESLTQNSPAWIECFEADALVQGALRDAAPRVHSGASTFGAGLPAGFSPPASFAALPLRVGTEIVGMIGLANRPDGYPDAFLANLQPLLGTLALFLDAASAQAAVADREVRLEEMHHRVKNNLQIVSSLMRLQERASAGADAATVLQESRQRVETIALLHEHLYQSPADSTIEFAGYAKKLVANLIGVPRNIRLTVEMEAFALDFQTAVLCGLVLNELLTNSLRHAFPDGREGEISLRAWTVDNTTHLTVSDNGIGMPAAFDLEHSASLGLTLVRRLARQLKGTLSASVHDGTSVQLAFPAR
jgi:two-component sensor histidine kinase